MVLLTDVYRNLTSLLIKPRERAFKQFKSPVLNVLRDRKDLSEGLGASRVKGLEFNH